MTFINNYKSIHIMQINEYITDYKKYKNFIY